MPLLSDDDTLPPNSPASALSSPDWPRAGSGSSHRYFGSSVYNYNSPYLAHIDEDLLARTIQDTGLHAFGTIFVELWVVSRNGQHLTRPSGGHWMDPSFLSGAPDYAVEVDRTAPDCSPGESLAGTLFNETVRSTWAQKRVHWRQIKSMMEDPFIQHGKDRRMEQLYGLGIGIVGTVPFSFQEREGIVLFMSRSTADIDKLRADQNEQYLLGATDFIGSAFAIRVPRMECSRIRRAQFQSAVKKVRRCIRTESRTKRDFASFVLQAAEMHRQTLYNPEEEWGPAVPSSHEDSMPESWKRAGTTDPESYLQRAIFQVKSWIHNVTRTLQVSVRKWKGAGLHAAPRQNLKDSLIAFTGTFCVMLTLASVEYLLRDNDQNVEWNEVWIFVAGTFSSSLCIIFALTAAPVGQPTQIVCSHVWNCLVGLAIQRIPSNNFHNFYDYSLAPPEERIGMVLPLAWKEALSVAFGVSGMAFLGIMHPPASGLSYAFATTPKMGLSHILMIVFADLIMIGMAMVILNLSQARQYPMFWVGHNWKYSSGRKPKDGWCNTWKQKRRKKTDRDGDIEDA